MANRKKHQMTVTATVAAQSDEKRDDADLALNPLATKKKMVP